MYLAPSGYCKLLLYSQLNNTGYWNDDNNTEYNMDLQCSVAYRHHCLQQIGATTQWYPLDAFPPALENL